MTTTCLQCGRPLQSKRNTKKYCSDTCKQLAFYKRSGSALSAINDEFPTTAKRYIEEPFNGNAINTRPIHQDVLKEQFHENPSAQTVNDKQTFTVKQQEKERYEWVRSQLVDSIADYADNSEALFMFQQPQQYWSSYSLPTVKWISLRMRCLVESLIKLSHFTDVDYESIIAVKEAFSALTDSNHFKKLPANYPFTSLVIELGQKIALIAKQHKHFDAIRFRLTVNRKVELIAIRYILADFVPAIRFSEMDFKE